MWVIDVNVPTAPVVVEQPGRPETVAPSAPEGLGISTSVVTHTETSLGEVYTHMMTFTEMTPSPTKPPDALVTGEFWVLGRGGGRLIRDRNGDDYGGDYEDVLLDYDEELDGDAD